jgi:hypothetical protein
LEFCVDSRKDFYTGEPFQVGEAIVKSLARALRFSERLPGQALAISFVDREKTFHAEWRALIREGAHYLREELTVFPDRTGLESIEIIDLPAAGAVVEGSVNGSPIATNQMFFGVEDPMATSQNRGDRLVSSLPGKGAVGQKTVCSAVIGFITGERQLRRDFLNYLEPERVHPDQPVGKVQELKAGEAAEFELKPYEVLVLEAIPKL